MLKKINEFIKKEINKENIFVVVYENTDPELEKLLLSQKNIQMFLKMYFPLGKYVMVYYYLKDDNFYLTNLSSNNNLYKLLNDTFLFEYKNLEKANPELAKTLEEMFNNKITINKITSVIDEYVFSGTKEEINSLKKDIKSGKDINKCKLSLLKEDQKTEISYKIK